MQIIGRKTAGMKAGLSGVVLYCVIAGIAAVGGVAAAEPKPRKQQPAQSEPAAAKPAPLNGIAQAMEKAGVSDCLGRANQITNTLIGSTAPAGATLFIPAASPNRSIVSASVEIVTKGGAPVYTSVTLAPVGDQGCGMGYDAVAYWSNACAEVAAKVFGGLQAAGVLKQGISVLSDGANVRVFLMPGGQGCISIKKELSY